MIRPELQAINDAWSRVRLQYDSAAAELLLADDFYAAVGAQQMTRPQFIAAIVRRAPGVTLVRFDNRVMTIIKAEKPGEWIALVQEKLEFERIASDGTRSKVYSLWYTRDGFRRIGASGWQLTFSQEVMHQSWPVGRKPPLADW